MVAGTQDQWKPTDLDQPAGLATAVSVTHMVRRFQERTACLQAA